MSIKINPGVKLGPGVTVKVPVDPTPPHTLTVTLAGTGTGTVLSTPAGIAGSGQHTFAYGTVVTLSSLAYSGNIFSGWSGDAQGTAPAVLTMDQDHSVIASFAHIPVVIAVAVNPTPVDQPRGYSLQLSATAIYDDSTSADQTTSATWTSFDESIATVNSNGLLLGVAAGSTMIRATYRGVSGNISVTINDAVLVAITITPTNPAVPRTETIQLTAVGQFSDGGQLDLTNQVTWSSTNTNVATIDNTGLATGVAGGTSSIRAEINGVIGSRTLFVGL